MRVDGPMAPYMAFIIIIVVVKIFFLKIAIDRGPTEVTQGPLSSLHYTHIKRSPNSRCAICSGFGFEDTAKMSSRSRGTCPGDLTGDLLAGLVCARWLGCSVVPQVGPWGACRWPNSPI